MNYDHAGWFVSIPSTSGKPVRPGVGAVYEQIKCLNPFNIREAGQTLRSKFVNADKHLQGCLKTKRRSEKLTLGMGLVHGAV